MKKTNKITGGFIGGAIISVLALLSIAMFFVKNSFGIELLGKTTWDGNQLYKYTFGYKESGITIFKANAGLISAIVFIVLGIALSFVVMEKFPAFIRLFIVGGILLIAALLIVLANQYLNDGNLKDAKLGVSVITAFVFALLASLTATTFGVISLIAKKK